MLYILSKTRIHITITSGSKQIGYNVVGTVLLPQGWGFCHKDGDFVARTVPDEKKVEI